MPDRCHMSDVDVPPIRHITSRRIVAAMREGESATLVGTSDRGGRFRHHYLLGGAPSAIDAATVASLR